ncbi:hypothetical protein TEA_028186 [Camellia sinensis var. sinensis]|uniref:F-box associated domain-containing protein n=1 Tax=Camellia sinensis var. sinensis TaxID=542762 RepID=A0A4S4DEZ1_CAMSN|nr:hypothetical protein TEA_028186 [Camellia sinensis var. sinensis]
MVRVTYVEDDDGFDIVPPEVELYLLSRGCWQSISDCGVQSIIPEQSPQVYINGAVHWIAYDRKTTAGFAAESLGPVIGFRKNSEVLLVSSGNLVSYNPETKEKKNHGIHVSCVRVCGYDGSSSSRLGSRERREWENVRSGGIVDQETGEESFAVGLSVAPASPPQSFCFLMPHPFFYSL